MMHRDSGKVTELSSGRARLCIQVCPRPTPTTLSSPLLTCSLQLISWRPVVFWADVLVSQDSGNKLLQTGQLKTTRIYFLTVLEASKVWTGLVLGVLRENLFRVSPLAGSCQQSLVFLGLWLHHSDLCLYHHMAFFPCVCLCLCLFLFL